VVEVRNKRAKRKPPPGYRGTKNSPPGRKRARGQKKTVPKSARKYDKCREWHFITEKTKGN